MNALDHVDIEVESGDFVAVMGPSGSGKSTLMNILGCLDRPDFGEYRLLGQPVSSMNDEQLSGLRNRYIGFVFQSFHLLPRMTALDNVLLPLRFAQDDETENDMRRRGPELLARLGMREWMHHHPNQLSGGQRQRVAIARSLVAAPSLLLADEPTGNLDSRTSGDLMDLFGEFNREGQTVLMVTHDEEVAAHARRVVRMRDGKVEHDRARN